MNALWRHEGDFTEWLTNNIHDLSAQIGLPLVVVAREAKVGAKQGDIIAADETGALAIIENQFGYADHKHLGQLILYLAELDAHIGIWVAEQFAEQHLAALRRLNGRGDMQLYAVQVRRPTADSAASITCLLTPDASPDPASIQTAQGRRAALQLRALARFWARYALARPGVASHPSGTGGRRRSYSPFPDHRVIITLLLHVDANGTMNPSISLSGADWDRLLETRQSELETALDSRRSVHGDDFDKWLPAIRWDADDSDESWDAAIAAMTTRASTMERVLADYLGMQ